MGKGSGRRQFNKKRERTFKKNHKRVYGAKPKTSSTSKTVYVMRDGKLVPKPKDNWIEILPIPEGTLEHNELWQKFVDKLNGRQLRELAR